MKSGSNYYWIAKTCARLTRKTLQEIVFKIAWDLHRDWNLIEMRHNFTSKFYFMHFKHQISYSHSCLCTLRLLKMLGKRQRGRLIKLQFLSATSQSAFFGAFFRRNLLWLRFRQADAGFFSRVDFCIQQLAIQLITSIITDRSHWYSCT